MDTSLSSRDEIMRRAIQLSIDAVAVGGGPFGAVIANGSGIVAEGRNQVTRLNDPTAHAEICAIRDACQVLNRFHLSDCVLFASCEPCPMCLAACYWARIPEVYYGNTRADAAEIGFSDALIFQEMGREISARQIIMRQMMHSEASQAFHVWREKADRVHY